MVPVLVKWLISIHTLSMRKVSSLLSGVLTVLTLFTGTIAINVSTDLVMAPAAYAGTSCSYGSSSSFCSGPGGTTSCSYGSSSSFCSGPGGTTSCSYGSSSSFCSGPKGTSSCSYGSSSSFCSGNGLSITPRSAPTPYSYSYQKPTDTYGLSGGYGKSYSSQKPTYGIGSSGGYGAKSSCPWNSYGNVNPSYPSSTCR